MQIIGFSNPRTARHAGRGVSQAARTVVGIAPDKPLGDAFKVTLSPDAKAALSAAPEVAFTTIAASVGLMGYNGYKCGLFKRGK